MVKDLREIGQLEIAGWWVFRLEYGVLAGVVVCFGYVNVF